MGKIRFCGNSGAAVSGWPAALFACASAIHACIAAT
jgi:hypothetical protein